MSESDQEIPCEPYQRAMALRKRNQSSELSDVFSSSTEALDAFEDSSQALINNKDIARHPRKNVRAAGDRLGYKHGLETKHEKGHGGVMRFLFGRGKGDNDIERRKSIVARKSLSRARRLRRKSGAGSQSQPEEDDSAALLNAKENLQHVTTRKKLPREPVVKHETLVKKNSDEKEGALSAKKLIAAAEARDSRKSVIASRNETLKRKADVAMGEERSQRSVRRKSIKRSYLSNKSFLFRRQANIVAAKKKLGLL